jgi:hypothetical protein
VQHDRCDTAPPPLRLQREPLHLPAARPRV